MTVRAAVRAATAGPVCIGVDLATAGARVYAFAVDGTVLAGAARTLSPVRRPEPGAAEQDAGSWWPAVLAALTGTATQLGPRRRDVQALAVTATSGTVVLADRDGNPASRALMYDDRRGATPLDRAAWLLARPGSAGRGPASERPGKGGQPPGLRVRHAADVLVARLAGDPDVPADWSHALKTGWDLERGRWDPTSLAASDVDPALLPAMAAPATAVGQLSSEVVEATALPGDCVVRLGMTDGCTGQLAAGVARPGDTASVLGTTLVLKAVTESAIRQGGGSV